MRGRLQNRDPWTDAERRILALPGLTERQAASRLKRELGLVRSSSSVGTERLRMELERLREQLACVRQALPETLRESVPSVAVATMTAVMEYDETLLRQALDALEYHREQTRPIEQTGAAIAALRLRMRPSRSITGLHQADKRDLSQLCREGAAP